MAAGYTTTTSLAELIPEITYTAAYIYQDKAIGRALVNFKDISGQKGKTAEFPRWTEVSGSTGVTETGTPTSHAMDLSMPTLTVARRSVYVGLGDLAAVSAEDVPGIGKAMAMAQAKQDDAAIFGVLTGTTNWGTGTGATNAAFSLEYVKDGILLLEKNEVDDQLVIVVHPHQYDAIRDQLTAVTSATTDSSLYNTPQGGEMLRTAFVSDLFGAAWFKSNRIGSGTVTATANVYNGLLFARGEGIGYAYKSMLVNGIEHQRDAINAINHMVMNYADSAGVVYGSAVCKLYSTSG